MKDTYVTGQLEPRFIYVIRNDIAKCAYVGLSKHPNKRLREHQCKRYHFFMPFTRFEIISLPLSPEQAQVAEAAAIETFRERGFRLFNKASAGSLGATKQFWTLERCAEEALKYRTKPEFKAGSAGCASVAKDRGWWKIVTAHMTPLKNPDGYWTRQRCVDEARKFETRSAFNNGSKSAYLAAFKRGWLDDICSHMRVVRTQRPRNYWTLDNCRRAASVFRSRWEFQKQNKAAYLAARNRGWLDEICAHMSKVGK
ncbi:GIY-YIG nuclease domain-containing protein [Rhizobium phage RHph_TM3_3_9]|nr:GIY-YIG nuclease domain-containing protein [Rhizobium phage RHph_TM3_3_9]QIG68648.1 GIY-YIG nuclease domain-containing protein [Rhizobium phage RHph_TM3_3_13]QIG74506.1 GIY-YIG nuclease domain-containing protein [Rhizobium phage RHph_TM3_3_10]QXV74620.1 GIY-YIG nuclease domain-containing protein [Rhizobium phage RHEph19]